MLEAGKFDSLFFADIRSSDRGRDFGARWGEVIFTLQHRKADGLNLSRLDPDQPLADVALGEGARDPFDVILQGRAAEGLTLGQAARRFATSELCPQIVGTPERLADTMTDLFQDGACDGFVLTPTTFPGIYEQFCRSVVPLLQRRGMFRMDYAGTTLHDHLGD